MKSLSSKVSVCTVALIALLLAVAPRVIGAGIEQATIDRLIELIPPEAESQLEIRRNDISSGWFRSSASIELIFTPIGTDAIALVMDFDIDHGPLLQTQNGLGVGLAYANIKPGIRNDLFDIALAELSFPLPDIVADLLVRFDQSVQLDMNISEINYSGTQGEMNFDGLNASIHVDSDQSARFVVNMGELAVTENAANSNVVVAGLAITSITSQLNDMLANSSATLSIPSLSSTAPISFSISDIVVDYGLNGAPADPQSSEIYQTLSIANIEGSIPVRSLSWRSEIKQLKNELLRDYYRLLNELQTEFNADPEVYSEELLFLGQELLLIVLQNPLEINNLIAANAFDGDHTADLRIEWTGLETLASLSEVDTNAAIAAFDITLDISLDLESILRSPIAGLIDPYVQQGYLTISTGRVIIEASLQDSMLMVNGDQLPLDQFF